MCQEGYAGRDGATYPQEVAIAIDISLLLEHTKVVVVTPDEDNLEPWRSLLTDGERSRLIVLADECLPVIPEMVDGFFTVVRS